MSKYVATYLSEDIYKLIRYGYFAVYKRPGLTCAEELENLKNSIIKGVLNEEETAKEYPLRAGHGGNLDQMASGVLAVALCDGCKMLPAMLASNKRYTVTAQLGAATDTYNNQGKVVSESSYEHVTRPMIDKALKEFVGEIWQKPPVYSALKINGVRASDIARAGKQVNLMPRPVMCYAAQCVEFNLPFFTLDVHCGHGFYVRSLVHDLAEAVGSCGHVTALERTKHGQYTLSECLRPENYCLDNIVSAISEARIKHPNFARMIENYWKTYKRKTQLQSKTKIKEHC